MKIDNNGIKPISTGKTDGVHPVDNANQPAKLTPGSNAIRKDSASVSEKAIMLAKAHSNLANIPDVRMEQVEMIKKSIEEGTYSVSPDKLASVLLKYLKFD